MVHPYTSCEREMKNVTADDCEWFWDYRDVKECVNVTREIVHEKMKPNCTIIPKYHCTERWEEDEHGNKVCCLFVLQSSFEILRKKSLQQLL